MKTWNTISKGTIATVALILGVSSLAAPAMAGWGLSDLDPTNKNSGIRQTGRDIDPTNPNGRLGRDLHAKFSVCNKTNGKVSYAVGNRSSSLNKGQCHNWTTTGQALINFDRGFASGYQGKSYTLNDGKYYFTNVNWKQTGKGIDLRKN